MSQPLKPTGPNPILYLVMALLIPTTQMTWAQNPEPMTTPFVVQLTGDDRLSEAAVGASGQGHFVAVWRAYSNSQGLLIVDEPRIAMDPMEN